MRPSPGATRPPTASARPSPAARTADAPPAQPPTIAGAPWARAKSSTSVSTSVDLDQPDGPPAHAERCAPSRDGGAVAFDVVFTLLVLYLLYKAVRWALGRGGGAAPAAEAKGGKAKAKAQ